ncbi:hypothetical protein CJF30_00007085 [Rutstroemia sp. NJR-2017a BBW]|nr:hypothetical protein CJF30_00007085 [Rutstroemia sp. NJR-2017a BBW]
MTTADITFPLFSSLPAELRLEIWSHLLPPPRIVQVTTVPTRPDFLVSLTKPPILSGINHESRAFLLSTHQLLQAPLPPIPISLKHDTLYLTLPPSYHSASQTPFKSLLTPLPYLPIRSLALDFRAWNKFRQHNLIAILAQMPHLREVRMVVEYGRDFAGPIAFLAVPSWRGDLTYWAERAQDEIMEMRRELGGLGGRRDVLVRCVLLTKGGEMV